MRFSPEGYGAKNPKDDSEAVSKHLAEQDAEIGLHEWDREVSEQEKEALRQQVIEDSLTGASSRIAFFGEFEKSLEMIDRKILKEASIVLLDLDNFKTVNDTHGHGVGDEVLVRVVQLAKSVLRGTDMLARLGGDEFVVLMPDANEEHAMIAAEKLRTVLDNDSKLKELEVTASLGVCSVDASNAADPKTLLKQADAAAYVSKEAGRNRVTAYEGHMKMRDRSET